RREQWILKTIMQCLAWVNRLPRRRSRRLTGGLHSGIIRTKTPEIKLRKKNLRKSQRLTRYLAIRKSGKNTISWGLTGGSMKTPILAHTAAAIVMCMAALKMFSDLVAAFLIFSSRFLAV